MKYSNEISVLLASVTLVLANMPANETCNSTDLFSYSVRSANINVVGMLKTGGMYQMLYLHSPHSDQPNCTAMGRAISHDGIDWQERGDAWPCNRSTSERWLSASAMLDQHNSSGLGKSGVPMVVIYNSYHTKNSTFPDGSPVAAGTRSMNLVYSQDNGQTWQQYHGNPLDLPASGVSNFELTVNWSLPKRRMDLMVFLEQTDESSGVNLTTTTSVYSTSNMTDYFYLGELGMENALAADVGEWLALAEIEVENRNESKWVLFYSSLLGDLEYLVGRMDGLTFVADAETAAKKLDHGSAFSAPITLIVDNGRRLITSTSDNAIHMPREINLICMNDSCTIVLKPAKDLRDYIKSQTNHKKEEAENGIEMNGTNCHSVMIDALCSAEINWSLVFENASRTEVAKISYDRKSKIIYIEKSNPNPRAPLKPVKRSAKLNGGDEISMSICIGGGILLLFVNNGTVVFTENVAFSFKFLTLSLPEGSTADVFEFTLSQMSN